MLLYLHVHVLSKMFNCGEITLITKIKSFYAQLHCDSHKYGNILELIKKQLKVRINIIAI